MTSLNETHHLTFAAPGRRVGLWQRAALMLALRRERLDLARMDESRLRDIGLTADEARAEASRPVWDVPQAWLR